jgi:hypothetical protein
VANHENTRLIKLSVEIVVNFNIKRARTTDDLRARLTKSFKVENHLLPERMFRPRQRKGMPQRIGQSKETGQRVVSIVSKQYIKKTSSAHDPFSHLRRWLMNSETVSGTSLVRDHIISR